MKKYQISFFLHQMPKVLAILENYWRFSPNHSEKLSTQKLFLFSLKWSLNKIAISKWYSEMRALFPRRQLANFKIFILFSRTLYCNFKKHLTLPEFQSSFHKFLQFCIDSSRVITVVSQKRFFHLESENFSCLILLGTRAWRPTLLWPHLTSTTRSDSQLPFLSLFRNLLNFFC